MTEASPMAPPKPPTFAQVIGRRSTIVVATIILVMIAAGIGAAFVHPKFGAITHVLLVNDQSGRDPVAQSQDMPTIATSTDVLSDVKDRLKLPESVADLQKLVTAHVPPRSSIMTIAYRDRDPATSVSVANAVADSFVRFYSTLPATRSSGVISAIASDLERKRSSLISLEQRLERASAGRSYVGSQASLDNLAKALGDLREQRGIAYAQLISDQASLAVHTTEPARTAKIVRHEILVSNPAFKELQLNVARDNGAYTVMRAGVTDQFPGLAGFRDKVQRENNALADARQKALDSPDAYSPSLGGEIVAADKDRAAVAGDRAHLSSLDTEIAQSEQELAAAGSGAPASSVGSLRAQRDAAEAQYQALALRYSNAQSNAAEANSLGQAIVVDRAAKAEPNLLGPNLVLIVGAILALIAGIAAAYLAESLDPRFIGARDVEQFYGRPTLASIGKR